MDENISIRALAPAAVDPAIAAAAARTSVGAELMNSAQSAKGELPTQSRTAAAVNRAFSAMQPIAASAMNDVIRLALSTLTMTSPDAPATDLDVAVRRAANSYKAYQRTEQNPRVAVAA